jgi:hypothetical protein
MRVAVHHPDGQIGVFRLGRIVGGVHDTNYVTGESYGVLAVAEVLKAQAEEQAQEGDVVVIERWIDNGDGTSRWEPIDENNPEEPTQDPPPAVISSSFDVDQGVTTETGTV